MVFGTLPKSQLLSCPADLAYFRPKCLPLSASGCVAHIEFMSVVRWWKVWVVAAAVVRPRVRPRRGGMDQQTQTAPSIKQNHTECEGKQDENTTDGVGQCCLLLLSNRGSGGGNRKWGEMCRGDQQERQEACFLWGEPRRKLSFSSVFISFLMTDSDRNLISCCRLSSFLFILLPCVLAELSQTNTNSYCPSSPPLSPPFFFSPPLSLCVSVLLVEGNGNHTVELLQREKTRQKETSQKATSYSHAGLLRRFCAHAWEGQLLSSTAKLNQLADLSIFFKVLRPELLKVQL